MQFRWESVVGKALIVGAWLLFAQVIWVGVGAGMNAHEAAQSEPPQAEASRHGS